MLGMQKFGSIGVLASYISVGMKRKTMLRLIAFLILCYVSGTEQISNTAKRQLIYDMKTACICIWYVPCLQ